jgi:biopolymer transport protein ExbB
MNGHTVDAQLLDLMLRAGSRWVLWLLLALSLAAVAVMFERVWFFVQERRPRAQLDAALLALRKSGPAAALDRIRGARSMDASVARACLEQAGEGIAAVEEHIKAAVEQERLRFERGLAFLGTLGSNAPFVGLFGTVLGIVRSFHDLSANTAQGTQAVMSGIAEALVATGVGLLVALPAVAAYNAFARHVESCASSAGATAHLILAFLKSERVDRKAEVA